MADAEQIEKLKNFIVDTVTKLQGTKGLVLFSILDEYCAIHEISLEDYSEVFDSLVAEKRLIEVEFVMPRMEYRIKTFYLPGNTVVTIRS